LVVSWPPGGWSIVIAASYPERYSAPAATANRVNAAHRDGGRVIAVGTTVVRALETVVDGRGRVHPGSG
jgi:S-adenosylmethionine:tRNA ribosyltransferase-isomerase